jgi:hypothetical protein
MSVPRGIEYKRVSQLLLDNENPRLPENAASMTQTELLDLMERDFDLVSIGKSMSDNGFFVEEPLIVIPKEGEEKFIVIEGNRRLAALKLLTEPELRQRSRFKAAWEELAKASKYSLTKIPVIVHQNRDDLTAILGFRHISGIMKWDPRSKARYIHDLIEKRGPKAHFKEIARELGSRPASIRDNYVAYRAYIQASERFGIDTSNLEENFSVFYRALGNAIIQTYIGLNKKSEIPSRSRYPVPEKKAEALKEIIEFVHGTSEKPPVITDSRQLSKLGEILSSPEALKTLRIGRNLNEAYALTGGEEKSLVESLSTAGYYLDQTLKYVHRHKGSEELTKYVERCTASLLEILKNFPEIRRRLLTEQ